MPFDGLSLNILTSELNELLLDGKVERIYQPNQYEINIFVYKGGNNHRLIISANPSLPRIYISKKPKKNPEVAPNFCMLLRKNLLGSKIISISQVGFERIIKFEFETKNELGDVVSKYLVFEMMGKHSNIFFINSQNKIIDVIKRISPEQTSRLVLPGNEYALPSVIKTDPNNISYNYFYEILKNSKKSYENTLIDTFSGLSKQIASEIVLHAQVFNSTIDENEKIKRIFNKFEEILDYIEKKEKKPIIYIDQNKKPIDFYFLDLNIYKNYSKIEFEFLNDCIDHFYSIKEDNIYLTEKKSHLKKIIEQNFEKVINRYEINKIKLEEGKDADKYKIYADLLFSNISNAKIIDGNAEVIDYYSENLKKILIPIDKSKSISENAQIYYKMFNKLKNAYNYAQKEMHILEQEIDFLGSLDAILESSIDSEGLELIQSELEKEGLIKINKSKKKAKEISKPYHFVSKDGFHIYVGKNNIQNDYLTLKFSSTNDLWFHTQKIPGSHVILKTEGKEIPFTTILECAQLSAFFSKAKLSTKVPVDYTFTKYIKKPPNSKPGFVIYDNFKTVIIDPPSNLDNFNKID
ncbi:NFACT family protein [Caldicellulosiruptoraceae bacterium PP1]